MVVKRVSVSSGEYREIDLPISRKQWRDYVRGMLIQNAMRNLSRSQREFILNGTINEECDRGKMKGKETI
jgi:hypothetical protein